MDVHPDSHDPSKADIEAVAAALPDALILVIEGQEHVADVLIPQVFADHILGFLRDQPEGSQGPAPLTSPAPRSSTGAPRPPT